MTRTFDVAGRTVRLPVPDGWDASVTDGGVRLQRGVDDEAPIATVNVSIVAADDPQALLDNELSTCVTRLTDFTVLHLEPRVVREENWPAGAPATPFILGGFRQGIFSLLTELGLVGGDGGKVALAFTALLAEEADGLLPEIDGIIDAIEIEWR